MNLFNATNKRKTFVVIVLSIFIGSYALADGTRQASPTNSANGAALLSAPDIFAGPYKDAPSGRRLQFTIVNHSSENLYFGFQPRNYNNYGSVLKNNAYYRILNSAGVVVAGPTLIPVTAGPGFISSYSQAFAGPNIAGATPAGYNPFSFDPSVNGDYYIELYASTNGGVTADVSTSGRVTFPFFDLTVSTPSNVQSIGRLWSKEWSIVTTNLISGNFEQSWNSAFMGSYIAYTPDAFKIKLSYTAGFRPLAHKASMNYEGVGFTGNFIQDRKSKNSPNNDPRIPNGYKLFLTNPDIIAFPDGVVGTSSIQGNNMFGCNGSFYIPYYTSQPGDISLLIDINGVPGYQVGTSDIFIEQYGQPSGHNMFVWNGVDGLGNIVPGGSIVYITSSLFQGRTNHPIFDVELNPNGFIVTSLVPPTGNRKLYWDDSALPPFGTCGNQNGDNITVGGIDQGGLFQGVSGPGHGWDGNNPGLTVPAAAGSVGSSTNGNLCDDYGNVRTLNTWFYAINVSSSPIALYIPTCDNDQDGIADDIDLDDDNDGIYDVIEYAGLPDPLGDIDGDGFPNFIDASSAGYVDVNFDSVDDRYDYDKDGIIDQFDQDTDADGIPDNIEAQTTVGYIAATGIINSFGVYPSYYAIGGLSPVNTDGTDNPDYKDLDSDNQGGNDTAEAGITLSGTDTDHDGLDNVSDATPSAGYGDVNGIYDNTQTDNFPDADNDASFGGDVDWRDVIFNDNDHDGYPDIVDLDDDNDGILDTSENGGLLDPLGDSDNDGIFNYLDPSASGFVDVNSNGVDDRYDFDGDGIINQFDLDSDNDGIFDVIEAGGVDSDLNGTANDDDNNVNNIASNGIPTSAGTGTIPLDFNNNGTPNYLNLDSDEDGCFDVREAGFTDQNNDGILGNNPTIVNASGIVTGTNVVNGYTGTNVYVTTAGILGSISTQPASITNIAVGSSGSISVTALGSGLTYQWQISANNGTTWTNITNGGTSPSYSGATSNVLGLSNVPAGSSGNIFRVLISSPTYVCTNLTSGSSTLSVAASSDLSITKVVTSSPVYVGGTVTYTISVLNNGPSISTGFSVIDNLPSGLTYNSHTTPSTGSFNPASMTWSATTSVLNPSQTATMTLTCNVLASGTYTNQAVVTGNVSDPSPSNNTVNTPLVPINSANVSVLKTASNMSPQVGTNITFTIVASNAGPSPANPVNVVDNIPSGYSLVGTPTVTVGTWNAGTWTIPTLGVGVSNNQTMTIVATVLANQSQANYSNTATINSTTPDPNTGNNSSTATPVPVAVSDLQVIKTISPANPAVGSTVTFTLKVKNNGLSNATGVQVVDNISAASGFSFGTLTPPVGTTWNSGTNTWLIGNLNNGDSLLWSYTATVSSSGNYTNTATVSGTQLDNSPSNNTSSATAGAVPQTDLSIVKTANSLTPLAGGQITFTLTATNNGPSNATSVNVYDNIPAGYSNISSLPAGSFVGNTWAIGNLASGASASITITATVGGTGPYNNTATISGAENDANTGNNTSTVVVTPTPVSNLSIVKTVSATNPAVGSNVTFTITVTNNGPSPATNITVIDTLKTGYTFVGFTAPAGMNYNISGPNIWKFTPASSLTLASGASAVITITGMVRASGVYTNCASVTASELDPNLTNNRSCAATVNPIPQTDLGIVKTVSNMTPNVGSNVTFTLTANNSGLSNASGVIVTDVIPTGYTFVGTLPAGVGSFNSTNNTYTWPIGNFNSGTSNQSVQVIVSVNPTGNYQNCASISGNQVDPNSSNNSSCITPIPNPISNLAIVKTVSPNNASVGDVVTFSLTVTNNGPSGANNVVVFDTLPSGFNYTSSLPAGWFNNNTHQWNIGSLANGATTSLSITATVLPNGTVNNYTNFSTVNSTVSDPNTSNNVDTARVNVTQFSNLAISKSYSPAYPSVGSQIVFTITATNLGLSNATGVIVNDPLPSGYTLDSIVLSSGSYTSPNWNIGNLSASTGLNTASMLVYAQVLPAGNYTNTAIISGNEPDPNSSNNTVSITPLLINVPPIANNDTTITIEDSWVSINVVNPVPVSSSTDTDIDGTVNPASVDLNPSVPGIQPNFTDAFGNTWLAVSTGVVTFTPASNFNGTATANYTVLDDDGAISNQALIVVYVAPINDAPILDNEYLITYQGDPISGDLTDAGDFDVDGNLIVLSYSGPTNFGSIVISSNGDFTYTPNTGFIGLDTFVVQICDDGTPLPSLCSNDTIFISVLPTINPIALNDTTNTLEDTQVTLNITSNDIDPDGTIVSSTVDLDTLTPGIQDSVTNIYGTWIVDNLGNVTFYPALNYYGAASVDYVVNDDDGATSNSATIYVLVAPVNDTPVVDNDYLFTSINLPGSGDAIDAGDSDIDGNLTVGAIIQNSQNGGTFVISPNGDFTYTPLAGYTGNDTIVVEICDDGYPLPSICVNDTIFIVIIPSNPPVANNDTTSVFEDTPGGVTFNVTNNDTDDGTIVSSTVDLDTITPGIQNTITNQYGTWTSDSSGAVTFVPASNYCGLAYAFYYISDNNTLVSNNPAQITVNVLCVNDGPITNDVTVATSVNTPIAINVAAATSDLENNPLTFTYNPPIGTNYTINGNGEITVNPPVNFVGTILIPFTVCDLSPYNVTILCDSGLITVNVLDTTGINNAPIANTDLVTTTMNSPVIINPLGNDYDPNGDSLVITILNGPTVVGSSVSLNSSTGLVTFTPATGFTGTDSVHYQICDNGTPQLCDDAYIIIVVSPGFDNSNTAPIATNDYVTIFEDSSITYAVLTNDIDPNGNNIGLPIIVNGPNFGSASVSATGEITYIPNANYNGQDTIEYQICDDGIPVLCDNGLMIITIIPVNDGPNTNDIIVFTPINTSIGINVGASTSDPENNPITYTYGSAVVSGAPMGIPIITVNGLGTINVSPSNNFVGTITIPFTVCDQSINSPNSLCDSGTITVIVLDTAGPNIAPIANDDQVTTLINTTIVINPLANDYDINGDPLIVTILAGPSVAGATATVDPVTGLVTYIPATGMSGLDSIHYQICDNGTPPLCDDAYIYINVSPVVDTTNVPPIAVDDYVSTFEDVSVAIVVLGNDSDPNGNNLSNPTIVSSPSNGTATVNSSGEIVYNPNPNFSGTDTLIYQICDDGNPSLCDQAIVVITINAVNDGPIVNNITVITSVNVPVGVNVGAGVTDPENNPLTYTYNGSLLPSSVTFTVTGNGAITVTPGPVGIYTIPFTVCDSSANAPTSTCASGIITVIVIDTTGGVNNAPIANNDIVTTLIDSSVVMNPLGNDFDVDGDSLFVTILNGPFTLGASATVDPITGLVTYNPALGTTGLDSIQYQICDNGNPVLCDNAYIYINVSPTVDTSNVGPIAVDDYAYTDVATVVNSSVLNNDSDPNGNALGNPTIYSASAYGPSNGTAIVNSNGTITYTPNPTFIGMDTVEYIVCDNGTPSLCDTALLIISVSPMNQGPITTDVTVITSTDVPIGVNVGAGTSDPENNPLTYSYGTPSVVGTIVTIDGNGTITVTPPLGCTNDTIFIPFTVCDSSIIAPSVNCVSGTIAVIVVDTTGGSNNAPIANNDLVTTLTGIPATVNPLGNDTDPNGDLLSITLTTNGAGNGTATLNSTTGAVIYTPNPNWFGTDSVQYSVCDNGTPSLCDTAWIIITVSTLVDTSNVPPIATNDYAFVNEDTPITVAVLNNDSDPNGNNIGLPTIVGGPLYGTAVVNPGDSTITYTPGLNFYGIDTVTYQICDDGNPVMCDIGQLIITVNPVNDGPTTTNITVITSMDTPIGVNVGAGTSDPENNPISYTYNTSGLPSGTIVTVTGTGTINVTPPAGYLGTFTIPFTACDSSQFQTYVNCVNGTITVIVVDTTDNINDAPIANNDLLTTLINTSVSVNPLGNDTDPNGNVLTASLTSINPSNGTASITNNIVSYSPNLGFVGIDSVQYSVCDNGTPNLCDTAWIIITVSPVVDTSNVQPIATDDFATTASGVTINVEVLNNDSDPNGNNIGNPSVLVLAGYGPFNGSATVNGSTINYTPQAGFVGIDTFTYVICDDGNPVMCDTAEVYINVFSPNDPPSAGNEVLSTVKWCSDTVFAIFDVLANNIDPNGDSLIISVSGTSSMGGTVTVDTNGMIVYTPVQNYVGQDTVIYTVCDDFVPAACVTDTIFITVNPDNDCDGVPDSIDIDDDNDGIIDVRECSTSNGACDTDGDGVPDYFDLDSDNDGIPDIVEAGGAQYDLNFDGMIDDTTDTNNNGLFDVADGLNGGTYLPNPDMDSDSHPNFQDLDSDNDGITDLLESGGIDSNGDGLIDNFSDSNTDGMDDNDIIFNPRNSDDDINFDFIDLDSDNDGISDVIESGQPDANGDGKVDNLIDVNNDGFADANVGFNPQDYDKDGIDDFVDLDSDNDAIPDVVENQFLDSNQDGYVDGFLDANSNGWNDASEGSILINTDSDPIPDVHDLDSDQDGIPDVLEGGQEDLDMNGLVDNYIDLNLNGWSDDTEGDVIFDWDNDGTPDYLDHDTDSDLILDVIEGGFVDNNKDGIIDNFTDPDNDGWDTNAYGQIIPDTDGDGIHDFRDLDSDGDGLPDITEYGHDCDNDGIDDWIDADPCEDAFSIPNGFTPNGDGYNDFFVITGIENLPGNSIQIFNRWGNVVFSTSDYQNDWKGTSQSQFNVGGGDLPTGTYYYVFETGNDSYGSITGYIYLQR